MKKSLFRIFRPRKAEDSTRSGETGEGGLIVNSGSVGKKSGAAVPEKAKDAEDYFVCDLKKKDE